MSDFKQQAYSLKEKAKQLGYEIKLTHCQELVAQIHGFSNRHALLVSEQKIAHNKVKIDNLQPGIIDTSLLNLNIEHYIKQIDNLEFKGVFNLGYKIKDNKISDSILKKIEEEPNALFIGASHTGKSQGAYFTTLTWLLSNSMNTQIFICDLIKGANTFDPIKKIEQVGVVYDKYKFLNLIDDLYEEALIRIHLFNEKKVNNITQYENKTGKDLTRVLTVIDEFHHIPFQVLNFDKSYQVEGTFAFKYYQLMKIGRGLGIWVIACSQKGTKSDVPSEIVPNFTQKQIFRVSRAEASYFLADTKAADITSEQPGLCETDYGTRWFPMLDIKTQEILLNKYVKSLKSESLHIKGEIFKKYK